MGGQELRAFRDCIPVGSRVTPTDVEGSLPSAQEGVVRPSARFHRGAMKRWHMAIEYRLLLAGNTGVEPIAERALPDPAGDLRRGDLPDGKTCSGANGRLSTQRSPESGDDIG
jgi:hypothetical protein